MTRQYVLDGRLWLRELSEKARNDWSLSCWPERRRNFLMTAVFFELFLIINAERLKYRQILNRKQHGICARRRICMLMQCPWRQRKDIALAPIETLSVDDTETGTTDHMVNRAAGMAMRLGVFTGPQQLNHARHRRQHWPAGLRMAILQQNTVLSRPLMLSQSVQCFGGLHPRI